MRVDPLGDTGGARDATDDLANALAGQRMRHRSRALLAACEQRSGPAGADVKPEELGKFAADRHLALLSALAIADNHDTLGKADIRDPQLDQLGSPHAGFEQGLQHHPGSAILSIGAIEKAQLLLDREPVDAATGRGRRSQPGLLSGGFENRLALGVIETLADEDGGDRAGGSGEGSHGPVCILCFGVQTDRRRRCGQADIDHNSRWRRGSGFPLRTLWKAGSIFGFGGCHACQGSAANRR